MIEYIFIICSTNKIHDSQIQFLQNMKIKSKKIILGIYDDDFLKNLNKDILETLQIRIDILKNYVEDIFIINYSDPTKCLKNFVLQKFNNINNLNKISIGSSNKNIKIIENINYKEKLFFVHNYKDKFRYNIHNSNLIIKRTDQNNGWCQDLSLYKVNWCFMKSENNNYNDEFINYVKKIMNIQNIHSLLEYDYDILEKYENMKIDWVVGWINPNNKNNFTNHKIQRLRDNNELLYFLKSVYKYCNWINTIYIILGGNGNPPDWYNHNNKKIKLIPENLLYKKIQRNSETKKLFYGNIPNLSDLFIAGDDDYLIGNFIYKSEFFSSNRIPIINSVHRNWDGKAHIPIAWDKNLYNRAIQNIDCSYYLKMGRQRKNPWIEIKKYLLNNNLAINGNRKCPDLWINQQTPTKHDIYYEYIIKKHPNYICINDDWSETDMIKYKNQLKLLLNFYNSFLPGLYEFMKYSII